MNKTHIYVLARPLSQKNVPVMSNLDHTWITTFPVEINPESQEEDRDYEPPKRYWYCWGAPHQVASHQVLSTEMSVELAEKISPSNEPAVENKEKPYSPSTKSGAIVYYSLDGLCHQTANQVLYATASSSRSAKTVNGAKGYPLATFFFGNYGLNDQGWETIKKSLAVDLELPGDEFLQHLNNLGLSDKQFQEVLKIRARAQNKIRLLRDKTEQKNKSGRAFNYYPSLFVIVRCALFYVLFAVGREKYRAIFPSMSVRQTLMTTINILPFLGLRTDFVHPDFDHSWLYPDSYSKNLE